MNSRFHLENPNSISVYVHLPYCSRKCGYCNFNSFKIDYAGRIDETLENRYISALVTELDGSAAKGMFAGSQTTSVFFGGGTPSLFSPLSIERVLRAINECFPLLPNAEITLEVNPGTLTEHLRAAKLAGFRNSGVNRISMGCQSFNADKLAFLGRIHSVEDIPQAIKSVRSAGFMNLNMDLIYGVIGESRSNWELDIRRAIDQQPEHISAYCLTVEPETEFGLRQDQGETLTQSEDFIAELHALTSELLAHHNYKQYELSNFARPGFRCEHNWNYWHGGEYLGLGAGAHSYARQSTSIERGFGSRWANNKTPEIYITEICEHGHALDFSELLTREQAVIEYLYLRLRCLDGFLLSDYEREFGEHFLSSQLAKIETLQEQGLLCVTDNRVSLTSSGMILMDSVLETLIM
jgi:oxygen-independent coproporphyrinogen III oxidase